MQLVDPSKITPAPEVLFHIGSFPISNTIVNTWFVIVLLLLVGLAISLRIRLRPGKFQNACEYIYELIFKFFDDITGDKEKTKKYLPLVGSMFVFLTVSNLLSSMPGSDIVLINNVSLSRAPTSDLNLTLVMALVAVILANIISIQARGVFGYIGKFFPIKAFFVSFTKGPMAVFMAFINLFAGALDVIGELARVISLSVRLFGNIFSGNVLLTVMYGIMGLVLPMPFMALGLLVAIIQAAVFSTLTLVYLTVAGQTDDENATT